MNKASRIERDGEYVPMPAWLAEQSRRTACEACKRVYGRIYTNTFIVANQIVDHIFPVRFLLHMNLDPHVLVNTISLCNSCHARKLQHETRIFAGDVLGFIEGLNLIGYPMKRVEESAAYYGFKLPPFAS
jgi:hypothetical protein